MNPETLAAIGAVIVSIGSAFGTVMVLRARIDRLEKDVEKLGVEKASKESLDGVRGSIDALRAHLDGVLEALREDVRALRGGTDPRRPL